MFEQFGKNDDDIRYEQDISDYNENLQTFGGKDCNKKVLSSSQMNLTNHISNDG